MPVPTDALSRLLPVSDKDLTAGEAKGSSNDVEKEDISTLVKVLKSARSDESALKSLISAYTAALQKQQPCKPGA